METANEETRSTSESIDEDKVARLVDLIHEADAVVVGGAAGMSAAGGDSYYDVNPMFLKYFGDLYEKLGPRSSGIFPMFYYPHATAGQHYLVIARMAQMAEESKVSQQYWDLKELLEDKEFFCVTTNQDQLFRRTFGDKKTAWIQGDWGWLQCGRPCHDGLYHISDFAGRALRDARDCAISDGDIPRCPRCGAPMSPWVRSPEFLEGAMYREQYRKYNGFLKSHLCDKVLFLELGVGAMTPMFIKEPFWNYVYQWPGGARYVPITLDHAFVPDEIKGRSLAFDAEIDKVLHIAAEIKRGERFVTQSDAFKAEKNIDCSDAVSVGW